MFLIHLLFISIFVYVIITTLYLVILTVAAYLFRKRRSSSTAPLRLAVVIPAHNEALEIQKTLSGVQTSNYAKEDFITVVIADNCEDETAALARNAGATVVERTDPENRGKGQALDWFFKNHSEIYGSFHGVVILDADTVMHPDFLSETAASLSSAGVFVMQGFYGGSNPEDNWRSALVSAALNVFHHVRPAGRNRIGGTAGLRGNGMAFRTEILRKYGWPAYSIVEDIEFSMILLQDGIWVHYNPDAMVYGEMATEKEQAETQRKRWEGGRFDVFKKYGPPLFRAWLREKQQIAYLDGFMELFTPPLSLVVMGQLLFFFMSLLMYHGWVSLSVCCLLGTVFYVFSGQILRHASSYVWKCLFKAPFFILWKIPIYLKIVKKKEQNTWERTQRKSELEQKNGQDPH